MIKGDLFEQPHLKWLTINHILESSQFRSNNLKQNKYYFLRFQFKQIGSDVFTVQLLLRSKVDRILKVVYKFKTNLFAYWLG